MTGITIIGGGASGIFLAIQLIRSKIDFPLSVTLIEKEEDPWLGVAYSTNEVFHLLNVRARKMSALPEADNHFLTWLKEHSYQVTADDFAPRYVYREYVQDLFQNTLAHKPSNIQFRFMRNEAVHIEKINEHEIAVHLRNKQIIVSNAVVLALGNFTNSSPLIENFLPSNNGAYYNNPWAPSLFQHLKIDATIVMIGTGPTMVDTALMLYYRKHKGKIIAISRHGFLPAVHAITEPYPDFSNELEDVNSLIEIVKSVRKHIAIAEKNGIGWRAVIDAMRPFTQKLWIDMSLQEKLAFLKYYKTYWEVARSRMPEQCAAVIEEMVKSGLLNITAGRIDKVEEQDSRIIVTYTTIRNRQSHHMIADAVINCMGPELNFERIKHPLIASLMQQGLICSNDIYTGIKALADGTVITKDGTPSKMIYTMGSLLRGVLWETIAIPEIRDQAKNLAELLLQRAYSEQKD